VREVVSDGLVVFSGNDVDFAPSFTRRFDTNLHILSKGSQEIHQTFDREGAGSVAHQCGDVRLFDPEDPSRFGLGEVTLPDKPVNLQRQFCFQELPLGMRQAEIRKNIAAALFHFDSIAGFCPHVSSAFRDADARLRPGGV